VGAAANMALLGGWIFLVARLLYVPAYLSGVPVIRTLIWGAAWVGLIFMLIPLLQRA